MDFEKIERKYVAPGLSRFVLFYPVLDENGKPVPQTNPGTGAIRTASNKIVYLENKIVFEAAPVNPKKPLDRLCFYVLRVDDPEYDVKVRTLERNCDNSAIGVIRADDYERLRNPAAYNELQQRKAAEKELATNREEIARTRREIEAAKHEIAEKDARIAQVEANEQEKDRMLKEAEERMASLMKGDTLRRPGRPPNKKEAEGAPVTEGG